MFYCPKCNNKMYDYNNKGIVYYCDNCICNDCNGSGLRSLQGNVFACISCFGTGKIISK